MGQHPALTYQSGTSNHSVVLTEMEDRFILEFWQGKKLFNRQETYKPVQYTAALNMPAQMQAASQSITDYVDAQVGDAAVTTYHSNQDGVSIPPLKRADEMIDTLMKPASAD